jgi:hypothetical protein
MRDHGGGRIGGFDDNVPQNGNSKYDANGCWKIGEACQWLHVDRWPQRKLEITGMPEYVDTTVGGFGEIKPTVTKDYQYDGIAEYQCSNDNGATWNTIPNDNRHDVDDYQGNPRLRLSGQTRNTGSTAFYPDSDITGVIPTERASVNGGYPDDGRLYRLVVTCGLRKVYSDYWEIAGGVGSWKGRTQIWNDRVLIQFQNGPCADGVPCPSGNLAEMVIFAGTVLKLSAFAKAIGEEHGEEYDVVYSWRESPNGVDNWTFKGGANTNTIEYSPPITSAVDGGVRIQNIFYIQCAATFTYSDPGKGVISKTIRPLVQGYSPSMKVTVDPSPRNVSGTPGNGRVTLSWTAPVDTGTSVTDYRIQYKTATGSTWSTFNRTTSTATSAVVTGLTNGTGYVFRVAAYYNVNTIIYSAITGTITPSAT